MFIHASEEQKAKGCNCFVPCFSEKSQQFSPNAVPDLHTVGFSHGLRLRHFKGTASLNYDNSSCV